MRNSKAKEIRRRANYIGMMDFREKFSLETSYLDYKMNQYKKPLIIMNPYCHRAVYKWLKTNRVPIGIKGTMSSGSPVGRAL